MIEIRFKSYQVALITSQGEKEQGLKPVLSCCVTLTTSAWDMVTNIIVFNSFGLRF